MAICYADTVDRRDMPVGRFGKSFCIPRLGRLWRKSPRKQKRPVVPKPLLFRGDFLHNLPSLGIQKLPAETAYRHVSPIDCITVAYCHHVLKSIKQSVVTPVIRFDASEGITQYLVEVATKAMCERR